MWIERGTLLILSTLHRFPAFSSLVEGTDTTCSAYIL